MRNEAIHANHNPPVLEALIKANSPPLVLKPYDQGDEALKEVTGIESDEERSLALAILNHLKLHYYDWSLAPESFPMIQLPESSFTTENANDIIKVKLPEVNEAFDCKRLNREQLKSIWSFGQFSVPSTFQNINHVWKVSGLLISGYQRRKKIFQKYWSKGLSLLYRIPRFYAAKGFFKRKDKLFTSLNLFSALGQLLSMFIDIFDLCFGSPTFILNAPLDDLLKKEIEALRSRHLASSKFYETLAIADFVQVMPKHIFLSHNNLNDKQSEQKDLLYQNYVQEMKSKRELLDDIYQKGEQHWSQYYDAVIEGFDDVEESEYERLERELRSKKFSKIDEFLKSFSFANEALKAACVRKMEAFRVIEEEVHKLTEGIAKAEQEVRETLKRKHPFRSRISFWLSKVIESKMSALRQERTQKTVKSIAQLLSEAGNLENFELLEESVSFLSKLDTEKKRITARVVANNKSAVLDITVRRKMYPPYAVTKSVSNGEPYYSLEKHRHKVIRSDVFFFRQYADIVRFVYWTLQLTYKFFRYAITGKFGLKGLLYWGIYYRGYQINSKTGEVANNWDRVVPVIVRFQKILRGIAKSRNAFESAPDNGFLGKNVGRVFNLIECYLFRFIIVGILGVLVLHSLFNVLYAIMCLLLTLTMFLWIILWLVLRNFIRIFIYDWEFLGSRMYHRGGRVHGTFQLLKHSHKLFPLPVILCQFILKGPVKILIVLLLTVLFPILALLMFLLAIIIYLLKLLYDSFMFYMVIKISGKVPTRDTNLARRIAGPGISRNLYWSISVNDSIILIQSFLELQQLESFKNKMTEHYMGPAHAFKSKLASIVGPFMSKAPAYNFRKAEALEESGKKLVALLNKAIDARKKLLPWVKFSSGNAYKIKFLQSDLAAIKAICIELLKRNIPKMGLEDFLWAKYSVKRGKYKLLMAKVLKDIVGSSTIFESIEEADERIVMEEEKQTSIVKSKMVERILEGEVLLKNFVPHQQAKHHGDEAFISGMSLKFVMDVFQGCDYSREWYKHLCFQGFDRLDELSIKPMFFK